MRSRFYSIFIIIVNDIRFMYRPIVGFRITRLYDFKIAGILCRNTDDRHHATTFSCCDRFSPVKVVIRDIQFIFCRSIIGAACRVENDEIEFLFVSHIDFKPVSRFFLRTAGPSGILFSIYGIIGTITVF